MAYTQADADMAARHVAEGQKRVDDLAREIAKARRAGHETMDREDLLRTMRTSLDLMVYHQHQIEADLARVKRR